MTSPEPFRPQWQQSHDWQGMRMPPQPQPPPVPPREPATNVAAIVALSCALVGLLVLPILLGPVAIVAGIVGEHQARTEGRRLGKVALGGMIIGLGITLVAVNRVLSLLVS